MKRIILFWMILALCLNSCHKSRIVDSDYVGDECRLWKITQRFGFAPFGVHPNLQQYGLYHYDRNGRIIKYEFFGGIRGQEKRTIYALYTYHDNRLTMVEVFISQNDTFIKTCIEEYEYDTTYRLIEITYTAFSEETNRWIESTQAFYYNDQNQVIKSVIPSHHEQRYYYDGSGNLVKEELYPLYPVEYEGPLTRTYTFDNHKNPFYSHDTRFFLPLGNGNIATQLSPNNVKAWESYSPETGEVVARSTIEYVYNAHDYPSSATETVLSPLTDPEPSTILWYTEYEYGLN